MPLQSNRKRTRTFTMLRHDMQRSHAWRSLSSVARAVWFEVVGRYNGCNNGQIPLSCREAGDLCNVSKNTAARAFEELQKHGFLKVGTDSSFNFKTRKSRRWILTHERCDDLPATNEWKRFNLKKNTVP